MEPLGILAYGYDDEENRTIAETIEDLLDMDVIIFSGTGKEGLTLMEIMERGEGGVAESGDTRVLVMLGFGDKDVQTTVSGFPEKVQRPIFATMTKQNVNWKLSQLIEHLLEEHQRFQR